jgi:hypothetical protein
MFPLAAMYFVLFAPTEDAKTEPLVFLKRIEFSLLPTGPTVIVMA